MIDPKKIMIGNYLIADDGMLHQVAEVSENGFKTKPVIPFQMFPVLQTGDKIESHFAIEITKDILDRTNLNKLDENSYMVKGLIIVFDPQDNSVMVHFDNNPLPVVLYNLHTLQNLLNLFTDHELKLS